jgi:pimeloyl-ACP methyl ester carboxylesterase
MDTGYADVPGGRIYYEAAGQGDPVILIHGGFGDRRMWDAQFAALARGFRVVRYDHRGFGRSTRPTAPYSATQDLLALLDHLEIPAAHIVGNSMGGGIALDFAVLHPDRVKKLVVVSSGANGYPYDEADFASMRAVLATGAVSVDRAATQWLKEPMIAIASSKPGTAALVRRMVFDNRAVFDMQNWPWEDFSPTAWQRLGELRMPVMFVVGDHDITPVQQAATAAVRKIRRAEIVRIRNADHLPQMVDPDGFNRQLLRFLAPDGAAP